MGCGRWWSFDVEVYTSSTSTGFWAGFVTEWGRGPSRLCCIRTDEQTNHKHWRDSTIIHGAMAMTTSTLKGNAYNTCGSPYS